jgi:nucleolar protein 56
VKDNVTYARVAALIGARSTLTEDSLPALAALTLDEAVAQAILDAAKISMGMDISEVDLLNVSHFTARLVSLAEYRAQLFAYLQSKMELVAPNLGALIGEVVGARLISHAGSLVNLAKAPASTIQILGAEKALFRALKTKGNTPKYGLIFHSSFIGRAAAKNKGRISRYLANKCAIASRIDSFTDSATAQFGAKMRDQVEQRLTFYETGAAPEKNLDAMRGVIAALGAGASAKKSGKKAAAAAAAAAPADADEDDDAAAKAARKAAKKARKAAAAAAAGGDMDAD